MNSVERVKALCKERKIPISNLERSLGFANGYISQLRKGVFPSDRLVKIADYFSVSIDYLLGGSTVTFFDKLKEACFKKGTSPTALLKSLGMSTSSVTSWKKGVTPSINTIYCLAESLGVDPVVLIDSAARPALDSCNSGNTAIFYDEYIRLCNSISKSPTAVAKEMGLAGAHVTKWKKGSTPTDATILKVCDYFNLPHDHFSAEKQKEKAASPTSSPSDGPEETKRSVIQSDNGPIYLENTYLRLAQGAKELGLDDDDVSAILYFFRKLKL